jgi:hypothetical protein
MMNKKQIHLRSKKTDLIHPYCLLFLFFLTMTIYAGNCLEPPVPDSTEASIMQWKGTLGSPSKTTLKVAIVAVLLCSMVVPSRAQPGNLISKLRREYHENTTVGILGYNVKFGEVVSRMSRAATTTIDVPA